MTGRYSHIGGDVFHATGRRIDLVDARDLIGVWGREAIKADQFGMRRIARLYASDAFSLHSALNQAIRWRRAAGIPHPFAAEAA